MIDLMNKLAINKDKLINPQPNIFPLDFPTKFDHYN